MSVGKKCQSSGCIECIILKNFMCHDNLVVNFQSGVNVIHGPNGSGKSAILVGLVFVLGTRASITSRASSNKDFIKINRRSASVSITLCNVGKDPFQPDIYGSKIIIQRKVAMSGVTSYKILNDQDKIVGKTKDEIHLIIEHFSIHVENPINILNQENSKTFLTSSKPTIKYNLFMRATNLQDMMDNYEITKIRQNHIQVDLDTKLQSILELKDHVDSLSAKVKIIEELSNIGTRIESMENRLNSRKILDLQIKRKQIHDFKQHDSEKKQKSIQITEGLKNSKQNIQTEMNSFNEQYKKYEDKISDLNETHEDLKTKKSELSNIISRKTLIANKHLSEIRSVETLYNNCIKMIESRIGSETDIIKKRQEVQERILRINSKVEQQNEEINQIQHSLSEIDTNIRDIQDAIAFAQQTISQQNNDIREKKAHIERYIKSERDKLHLYGEFTSNVIRMINEACKKDLFTHSPVGPIGALLKVADSKWLLSVELCLKNFLHSYITFSYSDKMNLISIFNKCCPSNQIPSILICTYRESKYDTRSRAPRVNYPTILDLIDCLNVNVINLLIDFLSIERILCIEDITEARNVMIPHSPPNVVKAYTMEGDELITSNNQSRFYSSYQKFAKFLCHDYKSAIKRLEDECYEIETQTCGLKTQNDENVTHLSQLKSTKVNRVEMMNTINKSITQLINEEKKLQQQFEDLNLVDVIDMQKEAKEYQNTLNILNEKHVEIENEINTMTHKILQIQLDMEEIQHQISTLHDMLHSIDESAKQKSKELSLLERRMKKSCGESNALETKIREMENQIQFLDEQINIKTRLLTKEGLIEVEGKAKDLESELKKLKSTAANFKVTTKEAESIKNEYQSLLATYISQESKVKNLVKFNSHLKKMIERRCKRYTKMLEILSFTSKYRFKSLLNSRGYDGGLEFNHVDKKLEISVFPSDKLSASFRDSKSLSGGERSFSTLSFIVSLWEIIDCPFRCLDEFDVFMDVVNRRIGLKLLTEFAADHLDQQIILITPQDIGEICNRKTVNIFKLDPPR